MKRRLDICTPELPLTGLQTDLKVFLAGPCKGAPRWQENVPVIPGVIWLNPRGHPELSLPLQLEWETTALRIADIVVFWIPAPKKEISGRSYAQTTRTEIGEILGKQEKEVVLGIYPEFPGRDYLRLKAAEYGLAVHDSWKEVEKELRKKVAKKLRPKTFFTSDTHFGKERTRVFSQRPFKDVFTMDWTMISKWNSVVGPRDTVYHLGDFGEKWPLEYLNGKIKLVPGNHDNLEDLQGNIEILPDIFTTPDGIHLSHEPSLVKDMEGLKLFGHIHGRQKVKPWGGVDVGVDAWGYKPVSENEVNFLLKAIPKYDSEVWD